MVVCKNVLEYIIAQIYKKNVQYLKTVFFFIIWKYFGKWCEAKCNDFSKDSEIYFCFFDKLITHFASHHFPKYFHIIKKKRFLNIGHFFYRFVMVVCKNVLEYIIALVVVKNKVR
jgi:hypothetical protein